MDVILVTTIFSGLIVLLLIIFVLKYQKRKTHASQNIDVPQVQVPRRIVATRNAIRASNVNRSRPQNTDNEHSNEIENEETDINVNGNAKVGAKKRAKLEAKAEKKSQREAELKIREQRKKQEERDEVERKQREERENLEEQRIEEDKRRLEEEKEKKEEEDYLKIKQTFSVEEEGFDEEENEKDNLLQEFINHVKETKVVMLEDLAMAFHLKIQTVINRIEDLQASGALTGVIDDRGKFIYITLEELHAVADFVKKRGRVTIQELVENSNNLITLN